VRPWTVVTYAFLHANLLHLLFNMIVLYFFGPRLEARLGGKHFLWLYFVSAIVAAVASLLPPQAPVVGASGAVFGVLLGFAMYWPHDRIYIWGVLPIEARWLIIILAGISVLGGLGIGFGGNIAHFAHLGGLVGGWAYLKLHDRYRGRAARQFRRQATLARGRRATRSDLERWRRIPRDGLHEINREELDRILKKAEENGPASLDQSEREFLERLTPRD
ncbi:MAG: rhomboid family intramembrane serine protease, partial [Gemmatimonadota bacterium]